jgi:septal ring factor EnvC (AmiA/AmiB activator)
VEGRLGRPRGRAVLRGRTFAALVLVALLAIGAAQVDRSEQQRLESAIGQGQQLLERRQAEIAAISRELGATDAELRARIAERDRVGAQLRELEARRVELVASIATLERDRAATEARIADLDADLGRMHERVRALLVNLHRTRTARLGGVLGKAETFHDLRVKSRFVGLLAQHDVAVVNELDALLRALATERALLDTQIAALLDQRTQLERTTATLQATRAQLAAVIGQLESTQAGQRAQQRALLEAQNALEAQLRDLDAALAREVARLREEERRLRDEAQRFLQDRQRQAALVEEADRTRARADALTAPTPVPAAGYVAPLDASVVTVRFGAENNSFVVLRAASERAAVRAVRGGVVISVADLGANEGHMVAIRHDATLTTVYTNLQKPVVAANETVAAGAVLGYLGGSSLVAPDVLRFYVRRTTTGADGRQQSVFVDPGPVLGL